MVSEQNNSLNFLHWFRRIGILEGISYLLLLLVAMPLKYMAGEPLMVRIVGMAHGILFIIYVLMAFLAHGRFQWGWTRTFWLVFASVMPFGPFVADAKILREQEAKEKALTTQG